ncbi:MAG: signal peptidase I [Oscillospiraceae bacterium]|jgi:signal peptidase I|nr:signal peptidase I [Oscillospiraceae bacterium]
MPNYDSYLNDIFNDDPEMQKVLDSIRQSLEPHDMPASGTKYVRPPSPANSQAPSNQRTNAPPPEAKQTLKAQLAPQWQNPATASEFRQADVVADEELPMPKALLKQQEKMEVREQATAGKQSKPAKPVTGTRKFVKTVSDVIFWVVCVTFIVGAVLFATSKDPRKSYFGYRTYNVITGSMTPQADSPPGGFKAGDVIITKMCRPEDIRVGDIITFNPSTRDDGNTSFLTHRVVEIKYELGGKSGIYFVTKGDANPSADPPISGDMLIGKKVFHVPAVGKILQAMRNNFKASILTVICFFSFIFLTKWYFAKPKDLQKPAQA